jgi:hypothetical protein
VGSSTIARFIGDRQADWAAASQSRISKTKTVLSEMKGIKTMALEDQVHNILQAERIKETKEMEKFNWIMVWVNVVGTYKSLPR